MKMFICRSTFAKFAISVAIYCVAVSKWLKCTLYKKTLFITKGIFQFRHVANEKWQYSTHECKEQFHVKFAKKIVEEINLHHYIRQIVGRFRIWWKVNLLEGRKLGKMSLVTNLEVFPTWGGFQFVALPKSTIILSSYESKICEFLHYHPLNSSRSKFL